jgi:phosphate transport system permease protein
METETRPVEAKPTFLATRRDRETRKSVLIIDRSADWIIRIGGMGVIVAVAAIMVFLVAVVLPLFSGGKFEGQSELALASGSKRVLVTNVDEYRSSIVSLTDDGEVVMQHLATGRVLKRARLDFAGKKVTAVGQTILRDNFGLGFADGTVRFGHLKIVVKTLRQSDLPPNLQQLGDDARTDGESIFMALPQNQFRQVTFETELGDEEKIAEDGSAIVGIDLHIGGTAERPARSFVTADAKNVIRLSRAEGRVNMMTQKTEMETSTGTLPPLPAGVRIVHVISSESGDQVYVGEEAGRVFRFDTRDLAKPVLAETVDLVSGDAKLRVLQFLLGTQSLVVGGSDGSVGVYFRLQRANAGTTDGYKLILAHPMERQAAAVVGFSPSLRTKLFVTADASGAVWVRHSTSERTLLKLAKRGAAAAYSSVTLTPRDDGVIAVAEDGKATFWRISIPHPETSIATIFGKVWYEGYDAPTYTWQSSAGTDQFEPKFSLVPLIFGTLKATLYALLFAVPIALLAAIFTSEFCHPIVRGTVKPVMEMMASLPSVVLGFIAALILAPIVETWVSAVILAFVLLPFGFVAFAYLWQLLPRTLSMRYDGLPKFLLMFAVLATALYGSVLLSPAFERLFFAGDFKAWTSGQVGQGWPFMFLLLLPVAFVVMVTAGQRLLGAWYIERSRMLAPRAAGLSDLVRWLATAGASIALALMIALALGALGFDPRGGLVDTYVQRNTLIVGFAMGFAVIPIIYTIAEDALNAVPEHLRAASLACGATRWQTAVSVILPTAVSGVFAAVMIGMGRAVGETMIVVMAAGNTPIMEWNVFNGLRALSANIAVELPEAVKDGSLYRMLFLAALTLFVMTFVVNTIAEIVRLRYRRRAVQL